MAYNRAMLADNKIMIHQVMSTDDPVDHSRCLREMRDDSNDGRWRDSLIDLLDASLLEKFAKNKIPREFLIATEMRVIGEATTDSFWGIGMNIGDRRIFNRSVWANGNVLGKALMSVRSQLLRSDFHHV